MRNHLLYVILLLVLLPIAASAQEYYSMDSGGTETEGVMTRTEEVYMWIRANGLGVVHACKGASHAQAATVR